MARNHPLELKFLPNSAAKIIICHCRFCEYSFDVSNRAGFNFDRDYPEGLGDGRATSRLCSQTEIKGDMTMRFMMLVKHAEKSGAPPKEFMDAMAILSEESVKAGTIRGNGGLAP